MKAQSNFIAHIIAFATVCIWGTTFVSTKILIQAGLTPAHIFFLRFILAYLCILLFTHSKLFCDNLKDELTMALLGVTGGSLYFLAENQALCTSPATNVSIIVCSCPLVTMVLYRAIYRESKFNWQQITGSICAFLGMAIVVCNGHFALHISPIGDLFALVACICWAIYSILLKRVGEHYGSLFINRKVFFYGLLTIVPYLFFDGPFPSLGTLGTIKVCGNLIFLGIVASFACFLAWTYSMKRLGSVSCTNYVYLNPLTTLITASIVLHEPITIFFCMGAIAIVLGLWISTVSPGQ